MLHRRRRDLGKRARRQDIEKNRARNALGRLVIWTAWSEASARANAGDRAARERAQEMGPSHAENFKKSTVASEYSVQIDSRSAAESEHHRA